LRRFYNYNYFIQQQNSLLKQLLSIDQQYESTI